VPAIRRSTQQRKRSSREASKHQLSKERRKRRTSQCLALPLTCDLACLAGLAAWGAVSTLCAHSPCPTWVARTHHPLLISPRLHLAAVKSPLRCLPSPNSSCLCHGNSIRNINSTTNTITITITTQNTKHKTQNTDSPAYSCPALLPRLARSAPSLETTRFNAKSRILRPLHSLKYLALNRRRQPLTPRPSRLVSLRHRKRHQHTHRTSLQQAL
jgi:hypothetical protein